MAYILVLVYERERERGPDGRTETGRQREGGPDGQTPVYVCKQNRFFRSNYRKIALN